MTVNGQHTYMYIYIQMYIIYVWKLANQDDEYITILAAERQTVSKAYMKNKQLNYY